MSKKYPFLTSNEIKTKIEEQYHVVVSAPTIRRRLQEAGLRGCIAKNKPLVSKRNRIKRLKFAKMFSFGKTFYGLMNPILFAASLMGKYMLGVL